MIKISVLALSLFALSACSSTGDTTSAASGGGEPVATAAVSESKPEPVALPPDEGDMICRFERTVGSRIGKRICRTRAQEEAARVAAQEATERYQKQTNEEAFVNAAE